MQNIYKKAADIIKNSNNIVFFGGAGVSTECGIPDFRSQDGLYSKNYKYSYNPETILSHSFFEENPDIFFDYLRENLLCYDIQPNKGHYALADLELSGKLKAIITQNIDGLHQNAGSKNVLELHGTLSRFYCSKCNKEYSPDCMSQSVKIPRCTCEGILRPDVTLYEESLDDNVINAALKYISCADTLIVAGTSLAVYPAAGFLRYFKGNNVIFINKTSTPYDSMANVIINEPFALTMTEIMKELKMWNFKSKIVKSDLNGYIDHPTFKGVSILPVLTPVEELGVRTQFAIINPKGEISPHSHDVVEVFTIIKGNPHILIDGDWIMVEAPCTIVAHPGEVHAIKNSTFSEVLLTATFKC